MQHKLNKTSAVSYYFSSWHFIYFDEDFFLLQIYDWLFKFIAFKVGYMTTM